MKTYPHLAGVVWSACVRVQPEAVLPDEDVAVGDGLARQRWLPMERLRHTLVVPGRMLLPGQIQIPFRALQGRIGPARVDSGATGRTQRAASPPQRERRASTRSPALTP
jgi:hypothetical protein